MRLHALSFAGCTAAQVKLVVPLKVSSLLCPAPCTDLSEASNEASNASVRACMFEHAPYV